MLHQLKSIDYSSLPISDYSRKYILRMLPNIDYYWEIYHRCLKQMLNQLGKEPKEVVMVDYGGGHGFLSFAAKQMGIGKVIYIDINPQAVDTVQTIAKELGMTPDIILQGDTDTLRQWCLENHTIPDAVLGMDVIEHIYRLEDFFAELYAINPHFFMLFTTGSTPFNPWVKRRLHRIMLADELGHGGQKGFFQLRKEHILNHYPDMRDYEADMWATITRGQTYADILITVDSHRHSEPTDPYNTCDPATGSWTERILPISAYQSLVAPFHASVNVQLGHYNTHRHGIKRFASLSLNLLLRITQFRFLAPFIILTIKT